MMASLHDLLVEEGFERTKNHPKTSRKPPLLSKPNRDPRLARDDSIALPIYICMTEETSTPSSTRPTRPSPETPLASFPPKELVRIQRGPILSPWVVLRVQGGMGLPLMKWPSGL
ncbi:hypothetical protein CK203_050862 [Vitis vinifera]|uniref:Uncharacterized protein n=1 Tax=Vitis vinifera TaxID=29760 RepID=A0A438HBR1_VITVI|nr:hypothetical protein CK203_050862 [Vitis vinifera]